MTKTRTNIKLIPTAGTVKQIVDMLNSYGIPYDDFIADPHCTVVYSKDIIDVGTIGLPLIKFPITGKSAKFEIFDTRDDGFCLVMVFHCEVAERLHYEIQSKYKLEIAYKDYKPHVTIKKNIANKDMFLSKIPFNLLFDRITMDNGK